MSRTHNVPVPIYVDVNAIPGHALAVKWETVCHSKAPFMWIMQANHRHTSRWTILERRRKWRVVSRSRSGQWHDVAFCASPESAVKRAQEWARL
jgi:acetamidase/formamidase